MRLTLDDEIPTASAIVARLQCMALGGVSCTVFAITFNRTSQGRGGTSEGRVLSRLSPARLRQDTAPASADRWLRPARPPHDLNGALTVRRRQHDLGPPGKLARRVAVAQQRLKLSVSVID
jgi:hypothetical protein